MPNLYVTEQGALVQREYNRVVVSKDGEVLLDVPAIQVSQVVLVGRVGVTTPALHMLLERDIDLVLLDRHGEFQGRLIGDRNHNTALRRQQYLKSEDPSFRLGVALSVVQGKLWNCRVRCLRIAASHEISQAQQAAQRLRDLLDKLPKAQTVPEVRAIEAQGGRAYFSALRASLLQGWEFPSRQRRPLQTQSTCCSAPPIPCSPRRCTRPSSWPGWTLTAGSTTPSDGGVPPWPWT